jgi:hypothetical protein
MDLLSQRAYGMIELAEDGSVMPRQCYIDLIKDGWILSDIVPRHPQLSFLDDAVRMDPESLSKVTTLVYLQEQQWPLISVTVGNRRTV